MNLQTCFLIIVLLLPGIYGCGDSSTDPSDDKIKITRITNNGNVFLPVVTHSRTSVMYVRAGAPGKPDEIRSCSINGKDDKLILSFPESVRRLIVSRDDSKLAFCTYGDTAVLYYYDIAAKELLVLNRGSFIGGPVFIPYFFSHNDTKLTGTLNRELAVIAHLNIPGGEITELTTGSHAYPLAVNYGDNEIYYQKNGELRIYSDEGDKAVAQGYFISAAVTGSGKYVYASLYASTPDKYYVSKMNADGNNFSVIYTTDYCLGHYSIRDYSSWDETLLITRTEWGICTKQGNRKTAPERPRLLE